MTIIFDKGDWDCTVNPTQMKIISNNTGRVMRTPAAVHETGIGSARCRARSAFGDLRSRSTTGALEFTDWLLPRQNARRTRPGVAFLHQVPDPEVRKAVMTESPLDRIHLNRRGFVAATLAGGLSLVACARLKTPAAMTTRASTGGSTAKYVALTFDDGPSPFTDRLLRVLADNDAKATFFLIGNKAALNPDGVKRIADAGMEIGNHTWEHPNMTTIAVEEIPRQFGAASAAIAAATGQSPRLYRPPGGLSNDAVRAEAARQGLAEILWDVVPFDWINDSNTAATEYMLKTQIKPGSLVDMHDTYSSTVDIVYQFLPVLKANGYQMVTVSDLLGPREPGSSYGRRDNGPIISGIYAEPQRPGKGIYYTPSGTDGVLVAWSEPPAQRPRNS